jgi:starvation-inducible DNA-binding protein
MAETITAQNPKKAVQGKELNTEIKSFPAPQQLATPTDLEPNQVQEIVECVNVLLADAIALYLKTKNYHWHLSGSHFREYHLLFEEQAQSIYESIDLLAERVRRIGGTTIRGIAHISQLQTIADDNEDFVLPEKMMERLIADNRHIAKSQRAALQLCSSYEDGGTSSLLETLLDETEKRTWFLYATSQGGKNME